MVFKSGMIVEHVPKKLDGLDGFGRTLPDYVVYEILQKSGVELNMTLMSELSPNRKKLIRTVPDSIFLEKKYNEGIHGLPAIKRNSNFENTFFAIFRKSSKSTVQQNSKFSRKSDFHQSGHDGKIRNFREKVIFTKVDMMGINRLETMSVVRLTYS
ncbi:hypothetical protein T4E_235 [Trichinella pseudospiralis]|uniref:Uncharacterized protein n=1 Tax=Trichinella pseudospiralis TaxID=6337 RepID=A0A0V0XNC9_TRIPS|nr:hypothetical protein T4E_235 [Trichinella pseudospiralis]